jgi:hypothetical protein
MDKEHEARNNLVSLSVNNSNIATLFAGIPMRTIAQATVLILVAAISLMLMSGCSNPKTGSLYDPTATYRPQPTITSVLPAGGAFGGMDTITINGTDFSSVLAENTVYFNATPAKLLSATPTVVKLLAPLVTLDSIGVRVAVAGSDMFSNTYQYKLTAAVTAFGGFLTGEAATSLAIDNNGDLYSGFSTLGTESGILMFTPDGARSTYAPATAGVAVWSSLKFGPGGYVYGTRNVRALYRFAPGGGSSAALWTQVTGATFSDLDFDQNGNAWVGGNNANIYRIAQDKSVSSYPFVGLVHSLRVYDGYLYFAARTDAGEKVWRAQISPSGLGTPEVYFDFASAYPSNMALAITFSSDGVLYIGTDSPDGLVVVNPDKSYSAPFSAYVDIYTPGFFSLAWGAGNDLYASSSTGILMKIIVRGKTSAPYYGSSM